MFTKRPQAVVPLVALRLPCVFYIFPLNLLPQKICASSPIISLLALFATTMLLMNSDIKTIMDIDYGGNTVPCRKTRFFPAHFTKLPVAPMVSKKHKGNIPHSKDL